MPTRAKTPKNRHLKKTAAASPAPVLPSVRTNLVSPSATAHAAKPQTKAKLKPKHFIAMAGNIGSGKTTAAKLISQRLGFELFDEPVIDNRFLKDYYADMKRWSFSLQLEFLIRRVEHHELIHTVNKSCVQDRTLYEDPEIFAKYLHGLGFMTNGELELYYEYFERLNRNLPKPDRVIAFDVPDVEVLLKRIRTRGRVEEKGISKDFLRGLNGYYNSFSQVIKSKYGIPCLTIDVSDIDIRQRPTRDEFLDRVNTFLRA
jgi:deoxyadenosine/deoxycytidine kinase